MGNSSSAEQSYRVRLHKEKNNAMSWTEFLLAIREMNATTNTEPNGDYLCFALSKNSVEHVLWKMHVKILCLKVNMHSKQIQSCKSLSFEEFMNAYLLKRSMSIAASMQTGKNVMTDTMIAAEILAETADPDGLCVICMDTPNQILLPCLHSFCLICVSQQMEFRTPFCCPVCRTPIQKPIEDSWEVADIPQPHEVAEYLSEIAGNQLPFQ